MTAAETAIVRTETPAPGVRRWELLTITDQRGSLIATAPEWAIPSGAPSVYLIPVRETQFTCEIIGTDASGRDEDREKNLLRAIREWKPKHTR